MVSITLSVPAEVKANMDRFPEMNWSGFVRQKIIEKTEKLSWREEMMKRAKEEEELDMWIVDLVREGRKGRFEELKKMGLVKD
jgi:hypothetical protein